MERFGISLAQHLAGFSNQVLPLDQFFSIAIPLVKSLGKIHEKAIVHKDLVPRNILVDPETLDIRLIDFSAASELSREHQDVAILNNIEGSLPYMAPEQTGRMNRDIDYRTDYYTLGISFFEILTGKLPFEAKDALEWVHCHISRQPPSAVSFNPSIPRMVSAIIEKLLSKKCRRQVSEQLWLGVRFGKSEGKLPKRLKSNRLPIG